MAAQTSVWTTCTSSGPLRGSVSNRGGSLDLSYELLSELQRRLWRLLAIFPAPSTRPPPPPSGTGRDAQEEGAGVLFRQLVQVPDDEPGEGEVEAGGDEEEQARGR
ncbi:MAG TPA: hypothetical protein VFC23_22000 [Thermoanaerobaculia bacterium]|nr:hypothetical protein [Thermoanaerobaculia bacterium]